MKYSCECKCPAESVEGESEGRRGKRERYSDPSSGVATVEAL
jgi:hypothetical protein